MTHNNTTHDTTQDVTIPVERFYAKIAMYQASKALLNTPGSDEFYDYRIALLEEAREVFVEA